MLIILLPFKVFTQDLPGVWTGFLYTAGTQLSYELVISQANNKLRGYSLAVFSINGVENIGIKSMKIKDGKKDITIEDDELIYNNYTTPGKRVTLIGSLTLEKRDSILILQGSFFTRSLDRSSFKGTIRLEKRTRIPETGLVKQLGKMNLLNTLSFMQPESVPEGHEQMTGSETVKEIGSDKPVTAEEDKNITTTKEERNLPPVSMPSSQKKMSSHVTLPEVKVTPKIIPRVVAAELASRKTAIIRNVFFESDSLVFSLYDNGQVDGDTVSVVVNDKIIIARQGLTTSAVTATVYTNDGSGDSLRVIMYAESLGTIPPNTGLLIIQDGAERHQIRFEGDLQTNSAVILRRKR